MKNKLSSINKYKQDILTMNKAILRIKQYNSVNGYMVCKLVSFVQIKDNKYTTTKQPEYDYLLSKTYNNKKLGVLKVLQTQFSKKKSIINKKFIADIDEYGKIKNQLLKQNYQFIEELNSWNKGNKNNRYSKPIQEEHNNNTTSVQHQSLKHVLCMGLNCTMENIENMYKMYSIDSMNSSSISSLRSDIAELTTSTTVGSPQDKQMLKKIQNILHSLCPSTAQNGYPNPTACDQSKFQANLQQNKVQNNISTLMNQALAKHKAKYQHPKKRTLEDIQNTYATDDISTYAIQANCENNKKSSKLVEYHKTWTYQQKVQNINNGYNAQATIDAMTDEQIQQFVDQNCRTYYYDLIPHNLYSTAQFIAQFGYETLCNIEQMKQISKICNIGQ